METNESSIEWLFDQMAQLCEDYDNGKINYTNYVNRVKEAKAQAKEMEKEQIIHAYNQSWHFRDKPYKTAEGYYNETFGGNNK